MASSRWHAQRVFLSFVAIFSLSFLSRAEAQTSRTRLDILVLSAQDRGTAMVKAGLDEALVPYTEVDLTASDRTSIDASFLVDTSQPGVRLARFYAVVLPTHAPEALRPEEREELARYEREFRVRQLDAYAWPSAEVGLSSPSYSGTLDGMTGRVTAAASAAGFSYLSGSVPFRDRSGWVEYDGALATPLAADAATGRRFVSFVDVPSGRTSRTLLGVLEDGGREEMVLTFSMDADQLVGQLLFPGMLRWLTRGLFLGTERSYLAVHVDDVFLTDDRWVPEYACTTNVSCPEGVTAPDLRMKREDVAYLLWWQQRRGLKLDLAFNGQGYDEMLREQGSDPMGAALLASKGSLRWLSHTYSHFYLGCVRSDEGDGPCALDGSGQPIMTSYDVVLGELKGNLDFARRLGIPLREEELVTGEHGGLVRPPLEPDNPNLRAVLADLGIRWVGSDRSLEWDQRPVGSALTVPRWPMNVYYNTGTKREAASEYNWIYASSAEGGSGLCDASPAWCIAPLDLDTGFDSFIVPTEAWAVLMHMLSNSPHPHYAHQSNLAEDRLLYPVLDRALSDYRQLFSSSAPIVNPTLSESGQELSRRAAWQASRARVEAYREGDVLVLGSASGAREIPLTVPAGTSAPLPGYGPGRTGWLSVAGSQRIALPPLR